MDFYNLLSEDYDLMTRFDERMVKERPIFEELNKQYGFRKTLDAGCGSGFHSILLSSLGIEVTGIDTSKKMIDLAKKNASRHQVSAKFTETDFLTFPEQVQDSFDAIFCLGNSLAHLLSKHELDTVAENFRRGLLPGGYLIIQLLNYAKILNKKERLVGITEYGNKIFIRFYDFKEHLIQFNILILEKGKSGFSHQMISTQLYPWRLSELQNTLQKNGFNQVQFFADLSKNKFDAETSGNLVVIAG